MDIGAANGGYQSLAIHGGRGKEAALVPANVNKSNVDNQPVKISAASKVELRATEEQRYEAVKRAASKIASDVYAVSDKSFSIFKDASGQYITRLTSLRDGTITYIPEQNLLRDIEDIGFDTSLLKVKI